MRTPIFLALPCILCLSSAHAGALLKPTNGVSLALRPKTLDIKTRLRGVFAQTTVTTVYANPNTDRIEADFLYSAPPGSVVTGFAYWYGEEKVVARVVEKARAAQIYQYITSRMRDPALIEKIGKNAFRARIFPVEARTDLKIEIQLAQVAPANKAGALWSWPLRDETAGGALERVSVEVASDLPARSNFGALNWTRTNWRAKDDFRVQLQQPKTPLRASLLSRKDGGPNGFFALSLSSDLALYKPNFKISGVETFSVFAPKVGRLPANREFIVFGRYKGSGQALVSLGKESVELNFSARRENANIVGKLWANAQLEAWGKDTRKRAAITALSTRFGIPSDFTSWLAIPEEERANFKKQMLAADRDNAGKAYAQAVARGNSALAKAHKTRFAAADAALQKIDRDYSSEEELQPLPNYLNEELKTIRRATLQAKYSGTSAAKRAQWGSWIKNLQKAGASDGGQGVEMPVYVLEDEMRIASRLLTAELEAGRGKGKKARGLERRLKQLSKTDVAREYEWESDAFLEEQVEMRQRNLATEIAVLNFSGKPNQVKQRDLMARFNRLDRVFEGSNREFLAEARASLWRGRLDDAAQKVAREVEAGREQGNEFRVFERELKTIEKQSGLSGQETVTEAYRAAGERVAREIVRAKIVGKSAPLAEKRLAFLARQSKLSQFELSRNAVSEVHSELLERRADQVETAKEESVAGRQTAQQLQILRHKYNIPVDDWRIKNAWADRVNAAAREYWQKALQFGEKSPQAQAIATRGQQLAPLSHRSWAESLESAKRTARISLQKELAPLVVGGKEDSERARRLEAQLEDAVKLVGPDYELYEGEEFWAQKQLATARQSRAHETAYQLAQALQNTPSDTAKIAELRAELAKRTVKTSNNADAMLQFEQKRLAQGEPFLSAEQYFARAGDPLISVVAPPNSKNVLAILPSGELKPLKWNSQTRAFEARFDIPTHSAPGDYVVTVIIVAGDGTRAQLKLHFAVDNRAPQGRASVQNRTLSLETGSDTDRVTAFFKSGERVELKRGTDGIFAGRAPSAADLETVTFVLTDRAHNRTTIRIAP